MDDYRKTVVALAGTVAVSAYFILRSRSERGPQLRGPPRQAFTSDDSNEYSRFATAFQD
jgi:hypothetical protein